MPTKSSSSARAILAANLVALMDSHPLLQTQLQIRKRAGELGCHIAQSTISRALNSKVALDIDSLDSLAKVFGIQSWRLIAENLGFPQERLSVKNEPMPPPVPDEIVSRHIKPPPRLRKRKPTPA